MHTFTIEEIVQEFIDTLREIGDGEIPLDNISGLKGICALKDSFFGVFPAYPLINIFGTWRHYSGNLSYPVPHPRLTSYDAYHTATIEYIWIEGEYAAMRRDLCHHVADTYEDYLEELR